MKNVRTVLSLLAAIALLGEGRPTPIEAYLAPYVAQAELSGVVYVTGKNGDVYRGTVGNVEAFDTTFAIGSVSKTFTAAAIELLASRGKLRDSDSLATLVPEYSHAKDVTIDELLNHTAGVPDFYSLPSFAQMRERDLSLLQIARWLGAYPLDFKPGTRGRYSNSGYILLALAIERASGTPYAAFLRENILVPFGLTHTSADPPARDERTAPGYDPGAPPQLLAPAAHIAAGWLVGNGSIRSNAADLSRWLDVAAAGKAVNFHSLAYPAGWGKRTFGADTILEQDGRIPGFASYVSIDEQTGLKVVVLSNVQCAVASTIGADLRKIASGGNVTPPATRPSYTPNASELSNVVGSYGFPGLPLVVSSEGGQLYIANANDGMRLFLDPVGPNEFFFRALYVTLHFKPGTGGVAQSIDWNGQFRIPRQAARAPGATPRRET